MGQNSQLEMACSSPQMNLERFHAIVLLKVRHTEVSELEFMRIGNGMATPATWASCKFGTGPGRFGAPEEWSSFPPLAWQACFYGCSLSLLHICTWQITTTCVSTSSISFSAEETTEKSREQSHRFGYCQRNNNGMFSLVSQKVMVQLPSANKKKQYEIRNILGTARLEKVMVRVRVFRVHTL